MEYDILKMGKKGVNWANNIQEYQHILNNGPKEVLAYKTPFEIYFARKCHSKQSAVEEVDVAAKASMYEPTDQDRREQKCFSCTATSTGCYKTML